MPWGRNSRPNCKSLLTETERLLYDGADRRTKFRLKYVEVSTPERKQE